MARSSPITPEMKMKGTCGRRCCASASAVMPSKPGSEKSDSTKSNSPLSNAASNAARVSTVWNWQAKPSAANNS